MRETHAVFLDRDGVINRLIFNPASEAFESPHRLEDLEMNPELMELRRLSEAGYLLFMITNQPSAAKKKTSLEILKAIQDRIDQALLELGLFFQAYFYCFHHPESLLPELQGPCRCRKPSPYFLNLALSEYGLDRPSSWMLGDQDTDILCAQGAGLRNILIETKESASRRGSSQPDFRVPSLKEAITRILK